MDFRMPASSSTITTTPRFARMSNPIRRKEFHGEWLRDSMSGRYATRRRADTVLWCGSAPKDRYLLSDGVAVRGRHWARIATRQAAKARIALLAGTLGRTLWSRVNQAKSFGHCN